MPESINAETVPTDWGSISTWKPSDDWSITTAAWSVWTSTAWLWWGGWWSAWWIDCDWGRLVNWQCSYNIYESLWLWGKNDEATPFLQDAVNWVTMFIWTVVVISLVVSGFLYAIAWADESMAEKWKSWIKYSLIWLILVIFSYTFVLALQCLSDPTGCLR